MKETLLQIPARLPFFLLLGAVLVVVLYRPVLGFDLTGDDYDWLRHARNGLERPLELFTDLDTFYRPLATWTWSVDFLVWHDRPGGYHLTNLVLFLATGFLLYALLRRWSFSSLVAAGLTTLWWLAPYHAETVASGSSRFETLLAIPWLGLALVWPGPGQRWRPKQIGAVVLMMALAMFAKETWVVTPLLVLALERAWHQSTWREALHITAWSVTAVAVYSTLYLTLLPISAKQGYLAFEVGVLKKFPVLFSTFFEGAPIQVASFEMEAYHIFALGLFLILSCYTLRAGDAAMVWGWTLVWAPLVPTLLAPYLPHRWLTLPYLGFVVWVGAMARDAYHRWRDPRGQRLLIGAFGLLLLVFGILHGLSLRRELTDFAAVSRIHARLLTEARPLRKELRPGVWLVVLRGEQERPLAKLQQRLVGSPKLFFYRGPDPYGLVDTAALFDYILIPTGLRADPVTAAIAAHAKARILLHVHGGFVELPVESGQESELIRGLRERGLAYRILFIRKSRPLWNL